MGNRLRAAVALLTIVLAGCNTEARVDARRATEIALEEARELAHVDCSALADCDRLWNRTKLYVAQRSATRIRHADDSRIETAEPHTFGTVYVWATRATGVGGVSTIQVKAMCRGMYRADGNPGWMYGTCADQIRSVETEFRSFVAAAS